MTLRTIRHQAGSTAPQRRRQAGRDSRDSRWQLRQYFQWQPVLCAAKLDLNFSSRFVHRGGSQRQRR